MKKLLTLTLALTLILTLAAPAFAAESPDARAALDALEAFMADGGTNRVEHEEHHNYYRVVSAVYIDLNQDGIPELVRELIAGIEVREYDVYAVKKTASGYSVYLVGCTDEWNGPDDRMGIDSDTGEVYYHMDIHRPGRFRDGSIGFGKTIYSGNKAYLNRYFVFNGERFVETQENGFEVIELPTNRYATLSPELFTVQRSAQNLIVNGRKVDCEKYNINGSNYFKLRDLAMLFNGTPNQFSVDWDDEMQTITVGAAMPYTPVGGELSVGEDKSSTAVPSNQSIYTGVGWPISGLSAFNLGGNNYYKLRELSERFGFSVDYDAVTNTVILNSVRRSTLADGVYLVRLDGTYREESSYESVNFFNYGYFFGVKLLRQGPDDPNDGHTTYVETGETGTLLFPERLEIDSRYEFRQETWYSYELYQKLLDFGRTTHENPIEVTITNGDVSACIVYPMP